MNKNGRQQSSVFSRPIVFGEDQRFSPQAGTRKLMISGPDTTEIIIDTSVELQGGKIYSFFLLNDVDGLETMTTEDRIVYPEQERNARIRFIHLSPNAGSLRLTWLDAEGDENVLINDISFKQITDFRGNFCRHLTVDVKKC